MCIISPICLLHCTYRKTLTIADQRIRIKQRLASSRGLNVHVALHANETQLADERIFNESTEVIIG